MGTDIDTILFVHAAAEWRTFHRRHMLLALAAALPEHVSMVVVDRPISPDVASWKYPGRFWRHIWRMSPAAKDGPVLIIRPRLAVHDLTLDRIPALTPANRRLLRAQLVQFTEASFPRALKAIQWIYSPEQHWVFGALPDAAKVYECYDEYAHAPTGELFPGRRCKEQRVLRDADLTFVTTPTLMERRAHSTRRSALLPNGVPDFFLERSEPAPDPIDSIPRPRIGYLGNLRPPADIRLLEETFARRRDWHLVFVGPVDRSVKTRVLQRMANVHFLGTRPFTQVPGIVRRFDVGLIPYQLNDMSCAFKPLKLGEYLACGVPVVATELPELRGLDDVVLLAPNEAASLESAVARALAMDRSRCAERAVAIAREMSWPNIVQEHVLPELRRSFDI